jgi:iron complex outermembrane recepter protein
MKTRMISMICGALFSVPLVTTAQNDINGKVVDEQNLPLPGVRVSIKQTYLRTLTNSDGNFTFKNMKSDQQVLLFEFSGYESKEIPINPSANEEVIISLTPTTQLIDEVLVLHVKADERTPSTYTTLNDGELDKRNFGQDIPYLLQMTPSTVVTSDAGAGVGYTGIRIRGVDPTRTNVTINGVPINDSESHGVFWVNMPDFASSAGSIQVQRGVGTSNNGAAAFGASINISTDEMSKTAYGELDNAYGSFNTWRNTIKAGTGLLNNRFALEARLSNISSDGYIDRASADLQSYYLNAAWFGKRSSLKGYVFSGRERTYQAWYGTPESVVNGDQAAIEAYADRNFIFDADRDNLLNSGRTYNFYTYDNEVDNYGQDHYQLHFAHEFSKRTKLSLAGHYTRGLGYFEQYRVNDDFSSYGLIPMILGSDTISSTDLIRRRWLDNHFFGGIFGIQHRGSNFDINAGGGVNHYLGDHFGEIIWAEFASNSQIRDRYYENTSEKTEAQGYIKANYRRDKVTFYGDVQYRHIDYTFLGIDDVSGELKDVMQNVVYDFWNPKFGFMVDMNSRNNMYFSMAMANREPVRDDFRESTPQNRPIAEQLMDIEAGYRHKGRKWYLNTNLYYMHYKDQLILTGQINDVGGYTRTNVAESFRAGLEIEGAVQLMDSLSLFGNLSLSTNKIYEFVEYVDNYDTYVQDTILHRNTDLAFSPNAIAVAGVRYAPLKGLELILTGKYVGQQFLDNTSSANRAIDSYIISDLQVAYRIPQQFFRELSVSLMVNNLFDERYENNGYTWGYVYGGERTVENFYYPQAGRHFMLRLKIGF